MSALLVAGSKSFITKSQTVALSKNPDFPIFFRFEKNITLIQPIFEAIQPIFEAVVLLHRVSTLSCRFQSITAFRFWYNDQSFFIVYRQPFFLNSRKSKVVLSFPYGYSMNVGLNYRKILFVYVTGLSSCFNNKYRISLTSLILI